MGISRRRLLQAAAGSAVLLLPGSIPAVWAGLTPATTSTSPNEKLNVASIGVRGMGGGDLASVSSSPHVNIVALCDVDEKRLGDAHKGHSKAEKFRDWRELLDKKHKSIDAVTVSTPDHMHAPITLSAMMLGKHVYCQKPLTHEIYEARQNMLAARRYKVVTQMGIQCHAMIGYRLAARMIQDGVIGKVKEVHAWSNRPGWSQGKARPTGSDPIPAELDWELWQGVAPARSFVKGKYHPGVWRGFLDFGTGALGDMGCHIFDTPFRALNLAPPLSVTSEGPGATDDMHPAWEIVRYEFGPTDFTAGAIMPFTWYDGGKKPDAGLVPWPAPATAPMTQPTTRPGKRKQPPTSTRPSLAEGGAIFIGEKGVLYLPHVGGPQLFPGGKFDDYKKPVLKAYDHYHQWVDACRGEGGTSANFDYAGPLTEMVLLGTLAGRFPGQRLEWDSANLRITNFSAANNFVRREYRKGWDVHQLESHT